MCWKGGTVLSCVLYLDVNDELYGADHDDAVVGHAQPVQALGVPHQLLVVLVQPLQVAVQCRPLFDLDLQLPQRRRLGRAATEQGYYIKATPRHTILHGADYLQ